MPSRAWRIAGSSRTGQGSVPKSRCASPSPAAAPGTAQDAVPIRNACDDSGVKATSTDSISATSRRSSPSPGTVTKWSSTRVERSRARWTSMKPPAPGPDLGEPAYPRTLFPHHGFALWNNFWYAGRYSFVTYSVLYYPLAALLGIRLLAVATVSTAALAFAVVVWRQWGPAVRWSSRTFALVWAGIVLSAAFPFALGAALALLAIWALQARRLGRFALLAALTLAASPLAFLLLGLCLAGAGVARLQDRSLLIAPVMTMLVFGGIEVLLWRLFPGGRYPFSPQELAAAATFCVLGAALTWRVERARPLRWMFVIYLAACVAAFLIPSALGENVARLRYAAGPLAGA